MLRKLVVFFCNSVSIIVIFFYEKVVIFVMVKYGMDVIWDVIIFVNLG